MRGKVARNSMPCLMSALKRKAPHGSDPVAFLFFASSSVSSGHALYTHCNHRYYQKRCHFRWAVKPRYRRGWKDRARAAYFFFFERRTRFISRILYRNSPRKRALRFTGRPMHSNFLKKKKNVGHRSRTSVFSAYD